MRRTTEEDDEHPCDICGEVLTTKSGLQNHKTSMHKPRDLNLPHDHGSFRCDICGRAFQKSQGLHGHRWSHRENGKRGRAAIDDTHGAESTFNSTKECYMDAKRGRTFELSNTRYNSDIGVPPHANFPPFATREVTEDKMDSFQHLESSGPDCRPFYKFLEMEDSEGVRDGTNHGESEAGRVRIDLNLKL